MKKELHEIENLLRESRLPDSELKNTRHEVWQRVIKAQRERRRPSNFFVRNPWIWTLGSFVLMLVCIALMLWLSSLR